MNELSHSHETTDAAKTRDWRKSMSDHVAWALLVYTGLQIFMTVKALTQGFSTILPYVALVVLVAAITPACRWFEKRWTHLSDEQAAEEAYAGDFRRDVLMLWALAISLPVVLTLIFRAIF